VSGTKDESSIPSAPKLEGSELLLPHKFHTKENWEKIKQVLSKGVTNVTELQELFNKLNALYSEVKTEIRALIQTLEKELTSEEQEDFWSQTFPFIRMLTLSMEDIFENRQIYRLHAGYEGMIDLTRGEAAVMLAASFFSLFPPVPNANWPDPNWGTFLGPIVIPSQFGKIRCILHYFDRIILQIQTNLIKKNPMNVLNLSNIIIVK